MPSHSLPTRVVFSGVLIIATVAAALRLGGCTDSCVAEGTMIDTPDGPRSVESLSVGSAVWSVDPSTLQKVRGRVVRHQSSWGLCRTLRWPGGALRATGEHPLYDPEIGDYREAREWYAGERSGLMAADGRVLTAKSDDWFPTPCPVRDLSIDSPHHNFVAGGVVVHNKEVPDCRNETLTCGVDEVCVAGSCVGCSLDTCTDPQCGGECSGAFDCPGSFICLSESVDICGLCRFPTSACGDECQTDTDCPANELCVTGWDDCFRCASLRNDCITSCQDGLACVVSANPAQGGCFLLASAADCYGSGCDSGGTCEANGGVCIVEVGYGGCRFCDGSPVQLP